MWISFVLGVLAVATAALGFASNYVQLRKNARKVDAIHRRTNGDMDQLLKRLQDLEATRQRADREYSQHISDLVRSLTRYAAQSRPGNEQAEELLTRVVNSLFTPDQVREAGIKALYDRVRSQHAIDTTQPEEDWT